MLNAIHTATTNTCRVMVLTLKEKIGRRLRAAREKAGLTLEEVAAKTKGLTVSRISNYEQGTRQPGPDEAIALARALGTISAASILCVDDQSTLKDDERALLEYYRAADDRGKSTISKIAEAQPTYGADNAKRKK